MTAAQKLAKEKFKKAIEYRKKSGVSLKDAFAHIYGKKSVVKKSPAKKSVVTGLKKSTLAQLLKEKKVNDTINKKFKDWEFPVPPVYTGNWTITDWTNWIKKHGKNTKSSIGDFNKNKALFIEAKPPKKPRKKRNKSANVWSVKRNARGRFVKRGIKNIERARYTEKISGIGEVNKSYLNELNNFIMELDKVEKHIENLNAFKKNDPKYFKEGYAQELLDRYNHRRRFIKTQITAIKKNIK